jgi:hypothetical protein
VCIGAVSNALMLGECAPLSTITVAPCVATVAAHTSDHGPFSPRGLTQRKAWYAVLPASGGTALRAVFWETACRLPRELTERNRYGPSPPAPSKKTPPVRPEAFRFTWNVERAYAAPRSDQAAIVACDCSPHGPRSPVGLTQRSQ